MQDQLKWHHYLLIVGLVLIGLFIGMTITCWHFPEDMNNIFGYNPRTRYLFAQGWGAEAPPMWDRVTTSYVFIGLWVGVTLVWIVGLLVSAQHPSAKLGKDDVAAFKVVSIIAIALSVLLTLAMPPLLATDIYNYLVYGRMTVFYGLNPYSAIPSQMEGDIITGLYAWDVPTHQGPIWTMLTIGIAALGGENTLFPALLLFKAAAAISHLLTAWFAYQLAKSIHFRLALTSFIFLAWNPIFLLENVGMGHNDLTMMAFVLAGLLAYKQDKVWLGYLLLLASVLTKFITVLLVFFYILAWLHQQKDWSTRFWLAVKIGLVGLAVLVISYVPFWQGLFTLTEGIAEESTHVTTSVLAIVRYGIRQWGVNRALSSEQIARWEFWVIGMLPKLILLVVMGWQSYRLLRFPIPHSWLHIASAWTVTIAIYTGLLHNSQVPWYWCWTLCTAAFAWQLPGQRWSAGIAQTLGTVFVLFYAITL